jgi:hypothetical protein
MNTPRILASLVALLASTIPAPGSMKSGDAETQLWLRTRIQPYHESGPWVEAHFEGSITNAKTAIIITDMWDKHWCTGATNRVAQIAKRMEPVLQEARQAGILIIHSPSDTMDFYANTPGRLLAQNAPQSTPPEELKFKDGPLPIDDSDEGCDTPGDKPHQARTGCINATRLAQNLPQGLKPKFHEASAARPDDGGCCSQPGSGRADPGQLD